MDIYQEVFYLSMLSNSITTVKDDDMTIKHGGADTQERLQKWVVAPETIQVNAAGTTQWQTVLGPTVWTHPGGKGADNTWFISHNPAAKFDDGPHDTYVLAIAGTATMHNWTDHNFAVTQVVDFDAWMEAGIDSKPQEVERVDDKNKRYISIGTARGMSVILNTKAPRGTAAPGVDKTVVEFIATLPPTARFILTGHSLGSALSTSIACALKKCGKLDKLEKTLVLPTAGPSPGNALFANYFAENFPASPRPTSGPVYQVWNSNLWNTLDIVPHAWSITDPLQQLDKIPDIWPMFLPLWWAVKGAVAKAKGWVSDSRVNYTPLKAHSFQSGQLPFSKAWELYQFYKNAKQVHTAEYITLFGLSTAPKVGMALEDFGLRLKTDEEFMKDQPFLELFRGVNDGTIKAGYPGDEVAAAEYAAEHS